MSRTDNDVIAYNPAHIAGIHARVAIVRVA
jgi:hypothetical protein